jgi:hypothetical protein
VWAPLAGAVAILALLTFSTVKVIVPRSSRLGSSSGIDLTPAAMENPAAPTPAAAPQSETSPAAPQLQPYMSTVGRFSVLFPGTPTQNAQQVALSDSDSVTLHQFHFQDGNSSYMVMYNDYPAQYIAGEPQSFLESIRDGTMEPVKATLTSDQPIDLNGVPGRVFKFTDQIGNTYTVLDFLDGKRLYQVIVTVGAGSSAIHAEDFLNSFRIL